MSKLLITTNMGIQFSTVHTGCQFSDSRFTFTGFLNQNEIQNPQNFGMEAILFIRGKRYNDGEKNSYQLHEKYGRYTAQWIT